MGPGGITFITHSGSVFSALLHNRRGLRFNLVVSTGLELVTTMDEYLDYALDQPLTRSSRCSSRRFAGRPRSGPRWPRPRHGTSRSWP